MASPKAQDGEDGEDVNILELVAARAVSLGGASRNDTAEDKKAAAKTSASCYAGEDMDILEVVAARAVSQNGAGREAVTGTNDPILDLCTTRNDASSIEQGDICKKKLSQKSRGGETSLQSGKGTDTIALIPTPPDLIPQRRGISEAANPGAYAVAPAARNRTAATTDTASATDVEQQQGILAPRNFPATPAAASNTIQSGRDGGLAEAVPIHENELPVEMEAQPIDVMTDQRRKAERKMNQKKRLFGLGFFLFCVIVAFILGLALMINNDDNDGKAATAALSPVPASVAPSESPSFAPSGALDTLVADLPEHILHSLQSITTPQWKALDWLSRHPDLSDMEEWRKQQLFALVAFFYAMDGESWQADIQERWLQYTVHECLWYSGRFGKLDVNGDYQEDAILGEVAFAEYGLGDPCNQQNEFELLILYGLQSSAKKQTVPPAIGLLTKLSVLSLPQNNINVDDITDFLPSEIYQMTQLRHLFLYDNNLHGSLPTEMGLLTNLRTLDLVELALSGTIPSELGQLTGLEELALDINSFSGLVPTEMGLLTNLKHMDISENALSGQLPSQLGLMTALTNLYSPENFFTGQLPTELGMMTSLELLYSPRNVFTGALPSQVGTLDSMKSFNVYDCILAGHLPSELGMMTSLTTLLIQSNDFSGSLPNELKKVTDMRLLSLRMNELTGTVPSWLGLMVKLEVLRLEANNFIGTIPSRLELTASNGTLSTLTLANNSLSGRIPEGMCSLGLYDRSFWIGLSFDCSGDLCGCCWCPCPGSNYTADCDPRPYILSRDAELFPGNFPLPVNRPNAVTFNIFTDEHPSETMFHWSVQKESGLWEPLDSKIPLEPESLYSFTRQVESNSLYRIEIYDTWGDGTCCGAGWGWFSLTNSTPSYDFAHGTVLWGSLGNFLENYFQHFLWINGDGQAQLVEYLPGKGYALINHKNSTGQPVLVMQDMALSSNTTLN